MKIQYKILLLGAASLLLAVATLVAIGAYQSDQFSQKAQDEVSRIVDEELAQITSGLVNLVTAQDQAVQLKVNNDLNVARHILNDEGQITEAEDTVTWTAINQYTKESITVELPKLMVGPRWLGQNDSLDESTPIVDQVKELVGGTTTIFQRMPGADDFLRVATNVETIENRRAIGTYIPAINPDGAANPVIATILRGETYRGIAYVVNAWYVTAYEPIFDDAGEVLGILYVGVKEENLSALREAIMRTTVGDTGYAWVLGGSGNDQGHYIVSQNGARDGENIWGATDANGNPMVQQIIEQALTLEPGETGVLRYEWQNAGDPEPRTKVSRFGYYEPWDWVIGIGVYEDELQEYRNQLDEGRTRMIWYLVIGGIAISLAGLFLLGRSSRAISRGLAQVTDATTRLAEDDLPGLVRVMQSVANGDLSVPTDFTPRKLEASSKDEVGVLTHAFNRMNDELDSVDDAVQQMICNLRGLIGQLQQGAGALATTSHEIDDASAQSAEATQQVAAAIQQIARGAADQSQSTVVIGSQLDQMAGAIERLVSGSQEQSDAVRLTAGGVERLSAVAEQVANHAQSSATASEQAAQTARNGADTVQQSVQAMKTIEQRVSEVGESVTQMQAYSTQIGQIVETIDDIADQTNLLALNAAIEAARAGEQGRGFAVVAEEVRRLAERSGSAAGEIARLIQDVQNGTEEMVGAMQASLEQVGTGAGLAERAGDALGEILTSVTHVSQQIGEIVAATDRMAQANGELTTGIDSVLLVVENQARITDELATNSNEIRVATSHVAAIGEENASSVEEVSATAEEVSAQVSEVASSSAQLTDIATQLQAAAKQFRLEQNEAATAQQETNEHIRQWPPDAETEPNGAIRPERLMAGRS